jgi:acyl-coenzyme A synthetase/AMP-(fatty) acid ligase
VAPHKVPKRIDPVESLPRNAAGKLLRDRLTS